MPYADGVFWDQPARPCSLIWEIHCRKHVDYESACFPVVIVALRSDCADAHAVLYMRCPYTAWYECCLLRWKEHVSMKSDCLPPFVSMFICLCLPPFSRVLLVCSQFVYCRMAYFCGFLFSWMYFLLRWASCKWLCFSILSLVWSFLFAFLKDHQIMTVYWVYSYTV